MPALRNRIDRRSLLAALAVVAGIAPGLCRAADWSQCREPFVLPARPAIERGESAQPGAVYISADQAEMVKGGRSTLKGNVDVARDTRQMRADVVHYDEPAGTVDATGDVRVWDTGVYLSGKDAHTNLQSNETSVNDASFMLLNAHGSGSAGHVVLSGKDIVKARSASYTTCDPNAPDWMLSASSIKLDKETNVGTARDVWVRFQDVPIFYTPFITFPLSKERKSGFLVPSFRVSGGTGIETTVPYYFNLAPNQDATLAVRAMSARGVQVQGQYRYLTPWGRGELGAEYMPQDRKFGDYRSALTFRHQGSFSPRWSTDVNFGWVSDPHYFEDLGTQLSIASQSFIERRGDLTYQGTGWSMLARLQGYQTVDETVTPANRPFARLPQIVFSSTTAERNRSLNLGGRAEFVNFDRSAGVTGTRLDLHPSLSYPVRTPGWFVVPTTTLHYTQYMLDGTAPGADNSPWRLLPSFSLDSGMYFDRHVTFAGRSMVQTLEPRVYYLYVPFDNQTALPVFDTGENTFSFAQLFREDRFSGPDRVGDANQVTLAVTTRLLSPDSGEELLRASVGQIRYLRDRRVTLPGEVQGTRSGSDLVAEVAATIARDWRALGGIQWNDNSNRTDRSTFGLRYQPDRKRVLNLAYRYIRGTLDQTDASFAWPVARNWRAVGRWNYALDDKRTLEAVAGIEYESCCWGLRTVFRHYLSDTRGDYTNGVFLQLELKGLAGVGNADTFLRRSIPGYRALF